MEKLLLILNSPDMDEYTREEVLIFIERKLDEHGKIRGQIARDLSRLGENAWLTDSAYSKLKAKYKAAHQSKKKLAILEMERKLNCKEDSK